MLCDYFVEMALKIPSHNILFSISAMRFLQRRKTRVTPSTLPN